MRHGRALVDHAASSSGYVNYKAERRPRVIWHIPKVRGTGKIRQTVMVSPYSVVATERELVRYATAAIVAQKPKRLTGVRKLAPARP